MALTDFAVKRPMHGINAHRKVYFRFNIENKKAVAVEHTHKVRQIEIIEIKMAERNLKKIIGKGPS